MGEPDASTRSTEATGHAPVLAEAVLAGVDPQPGEIVLDATIGRGGHAALILPRLAPGGRLIGLDLDPANAAFAEQRLRDHPSANDVRLDIQHGDFAAVREHLDRLGVNRIDALLADLGFASNQMDEPARGFSFQHDAPLDMRLDPTQDRTAADLLAELEPQELADVIYQYGEERLSRVIARKVVERRDVEPIKTTMELAAICRAAYGRLGGRQRIHPATRTFMALRIAVNRELERLEALLGQLPDLLAAGGRAAVIGFHSLEDRRVKQAFRQWADDGRAILPRRKPHQADDAERAANPRSRSAKLRVLHWRGGATGGDA